MNDETYRQSFYPCDCTQHAAVTSYTEEGDGFPPIIAVEYWVYGGNGRAWGLRARLRYAWHIVRYGSLQAYDVILTPDTAWEMGQQLVQYAAMANRGNTEETT